MIAGLLELALGIAAWARQAAGADLYRSAAWIRLGLGLDQAWDLPAGAPWLPLPAALVCLAVGLRGLRRPYRQGSAGFYAGVLVATAMAMGALLAADALLWLGCVELLAVTCWYAVGSAGGSPSVRRANLYLRVCEVGNVLLTVGVVVAGVRHAACFGPLSFSLADLTAEGAVSLPAAPLAIGLVAWLLAAASMVTKPAGGRRSVAPIAVLTAWVALAAGRRLLLPALHGEWPGGPEAPPNGPPGWPGEPLTAAAAVGLGLVLATAGLGLSVRYVGQAAANAQQRIGLAGLGRRSPGTALAMVIALASLLCLPLTTTWPPAIALLAAGLVAGGTGWSLLAWGCLGVGRVLAVGPVSAMLLERPGEGGLLPPLPGWRGQAYRVAITALVTALLTLGLLPQLAMVPLLGWLG